MGIMMHHGTQEKLSHFSKVLSLPLLSQYTPESRQKFVDLKAQLGHYSYDLACFCQSFIHFHQHFDTIFIHFLHFSYLFIHSKWFQYVSLDSKRALEVPMGMLWLDVEDENSTENEAAREARPPSTSFKSM